MSDFKVIKLDRRYLAKRDYGFNYVVKFKKEYGLNQQYYNFKSLLTKLLEYNELCFHWHEYAPFQQQITTAPWVYDYHHKQFNQVYIRNKNDLDSALTFFVLTS